MKILIFIDGQNFYRSLLRFDDGLVVDYDRLASWITQTVGGPNGIFGGAHYYVGVSPGAPAPVESFLKGLEGRRGYFVRRERRVRRGIRVHDREARGHAPGCRPHPLRRQRGVRRSRARVRRR